mgnify:FL=1
MLTPDIPAQEIWLIRHGVSIWNIEQIHQGQSPRDPGLAPEGKNQASAIGAKLKSERILSIHASPLPRAMETAGIINDNLENRTNIFYESGLKEISHGVADGISYQAVFKDYTDNWKAWLGREMEKSCFPGGESQARAQTRMTRTMFLLACHLSGKIKSPQNFYRQNYKIIVVAHGGVNKLFLAHVLGLPVKDNFDIHQENGCINILLWDGEKFLVKADDHGKPMINLTDHLNEHRMSPNIKI